MAGRKAWIRTSSSPSMVWSLGFRPEWWGVASVRIVSAATKQSNAEERVHHEELEE